MYNPILGVILIIIGFHIVQVVIACSGLDTGEIQEKSEFKKFMFIPLYIWYWFFMNSMKKYRRLK